MNLGMNSFISSFPPSLTPLPPFFFLSFKKLRKKKKKQNLEFKGIPESQE